MQKTGYFIALLILLTISSCNLFKEKPNEVRTFSSDLESRSFSSCWTGLESVIEGNAYSGNHFSRTNNQHPFGFGYESELPNFIKTKNFALELEFHFRMQTKDSKAALTITVVLGDSLIYKENLLVSADSAINRWATFRSKTKFPGSLPPNARLSVTLQNKGLSFLDVDDYKVSFNRIGRPSFLVSAKKSMGAPFLSSYSFRPVYKNKYYTITYSDKLGDLEIRSAKNDKIFSSIRYYIQWMQGKDTLSGFAEKLFFMKGDKDELQISGETKVSQFTLKLFVSDESPLIKAESKTVFKDSIRLIRESICIDYSPDESEIYRKNGILDNKRIRNEYWLDKEGFKIGSNAKTVYFYHNPEISSVQLSTKINEITINLDYNKDHPLAYLNAINQMQDLSFNRCKAGSSRENSFQFYIGFDVGSLPRFMKSPNGYLSSYVITSEEDNMDIKTKLANGIGSGAPFVQNSYFSFFQDDSSYNFNEHLIFPYPGFGDFFPTPNYWTNATIAPDIYLWRPNPFINESVNWNSLFTIQRLKDFVDNKGVIFSSCQPIGFKEVKDSLVRALAFEKIQKQFKLYKNLRLINFTTVREIMEYWLGLEKIKFQILPDGKFKLYNAGYQNIKGLSLAVKADSVFINNKIPENYYKEDHGDIIVWFDLPALKSVIVGVKRSDE